MHIKKLGAARSHDQSEADHSGSAGTAQIAAAAWAWFHHHGGGSTSSSSSSSMKPEFVKQAPPQPNSTSRRPSRFKLEAEIQHSAGIDLPDDDSTFMIENGDALVSLFDSFELEAVSKKLAEALAVAGDVCNNTNKSTPDPAPDVARVDQFRRPAEAAAVPAREPAGRLGALPPANPPAPTGSNHAGDSHRLLHHLSGALHHLVHFRIPSPVGICDSVAVADSTFQISAAAQKSKLRRHPSPAATAASRRRQHQPRQRQLVSMQRRSGPPRSHDHCVKADNIVHLERLVGIRDKVDVEDAMVCSYEQNTQSSNTHFQHHHHYHHHYHHIIPFQIPKDHHHLGTK